MKPFFRLLLSIIFSWLLVAVSNGQGNNKRLVVHQYPGLSRVQDSIRAVRLQVLTVPEMYRTRSLPPIVDNSKNDFWPGILDQYMFYTCQQYCGVAYVFGYEINRLRNQPGWYWENSYPTHYTWNFMNQGERYVGVDFLQSFEAIRQQGHMTCTDYGYDTATSCTGWISGYDKYYHGMHNHVKKVSAIEVNSAAGISTLKNYLYDHLDGSPTGGIACFTTDSYTLVNMPVIPAGTPEAGKFIIPGWYHSPTHGMTVVGYNDSVRFDLNGDGKYTNNLDITGDGRVDARDWEIGGFKIANSYGNWWADTGFVYALYRSFALNYEEGGVWNNRVYVLDADTAYTPLLTLRVKLNYNKRNRIRILAGVSGDTMSQMPENVMDFPVLNFQGGEHVMQGRDDVPEAATIETGLDVTSLLNLVPPGLPARFFLAVEERDPDHTGMGVIQPSSLISYQNGVHGFPFNSSDVSIQDNNVTLVSAVVPVEKPLVQITTNSLPPVIPQQPYQAQLMAEGGHPPYNWSILEDYTVQPIQEAMPLITGSSLVNNGGVKPFGPVALPFSFPFFGKKYDSIYVNFYGYITFEPLYLPGLYTTDEVSMLKMISCIAPAFSQKFTYQANKNDGIFIQTGPACVIIRWKASVSGYVTSSADDFALVLYPDGRFEYRYGTMENQGFLQTCYTGVSKGDDLNSDIQTRWNVNDLSGKSFRFIPPVIPAGLTLSSQGVLSCSQSDSTRMYDLTVQVADAGKITHSKVLALSSGLAIDCSVAGNDHNQLEYGNPEQLRMIVTNTGLQSLQNLVIKIRSSDTLLEIEDSTFTVALLQPSQTLTVPAAFSFGLNQPLPNGQPVMVSLMAGSGQRIWNKNLKFTVAAPALVVHFPQLRDGVDDLLDPGEVADLVIPVENSGMLPARRLQLKVVSLDTMVSVLSDSSIFIDQVGALSLKEIHYALKASRHTKPGHQASMKLMLTDSLNVIQILNFSLPVGKKQVALVSLSQSKASMLTMEAAFDSLNIGYDTIGTIGALPVDYGSYASVFLILGTATSGWHTLSDYEASNLVSYLQQHGNLYMEGYLTWSYTNNTPLHPYFKYTTAKIPDYTYQHISGVPGTFSDSISFVYSAPLNHAIFSFEPVAPAYSTMLNADVPPKNFEIVYDGADYRTIGTFLGFDGLTGSAYPSTRVNLMKHYLGFFGFNFTGLNPFFHTSNTRICQGHTIGFTDDSFDHVTSWNWEFPGGTPSSSTLQNPTVRYDTNGAFNVALTISNGSATKSILKKNYITVSQCAGNEELAVAPWLRIYPNPASEKVNIEISKEIKGAIRISLLDITGRRMFEKQHFSATGGGTITLDVARFRKGLWFLRVQSGEKILTQKLILY